MTVETEVAALTTAVDNLTSAVNVKKATLDASVSDAEAAQGAAAASATTASGHATSAAASASAAASTASGIAGFDLDAIAETKAVTAVDVFVYDTSKDSDGGAWRKRTQHTSWYNETLNTATRGSRREFPAVAVIVAEADKVTIYDGDDPALPMWMVFNASGAISSTSNMLPGTNIVSSKIMNGRLAVGMGATTDASRAGLVVLDFLSEEYWNHRTDSPNYGGYPERISGRNAGVGHTQKTVANIVNNTVNDVAMTVLPDAPIDPATGLPVPTIAVGCGVAGQPNGGTSIIKHDGTVIDFVASTGAGGYAGYYVAFGPNNELICNHSFNHTWGHIHIFDTLPTTDIGPTTTPAGARNYAPSSSSPSLRGALANLPEIRGIAALDNGDFALALQNTGGKLAIVRENKSDKDKTQVNYITSTYNTGWMNGDIKGAFLSSTDATSLVASGELVTNGTFDTDVSGWTDSSTGTGSISWNASGYLDLNSTDSDNRGIASQSFSTVVGETYVITSSQVGGLSGLFRVGTSVGGSQNLSQSQVTGDYVNTFVATATITYVTIYGNPSGTTSYDNISVKLADADRSVNNKGLIPNGTVTRSPVATGAELVGYQFSGSGLNYMTLPPNVINDLGTEWSILLWKRQINTAVWDFWLSMTKGDGTTVHGSSFGKKSLGYYTVGNGTTTIENIAGTRTQQHYEDTVNWHMLAYVCDSNGIRVYADGALDGSTPAILDLTFPSSDYFWVVNGEASDAGNVSTVHDGRQKDLALLRMSKSALTAEQIKKIYEDEKVLFQENAAATLYGTSDAVTALAHDSDTGLLHVGTSAGRSVFQGLRRVSNTTTPVGTAISASNGLVVEE